MGFRRADLPEPAPAGWADLGLKPGYEVLTVKTEAESDALCRAGGVSASDQFNKHRIASCVIPRRRQVILHDVSADDPVKMQALEDHEFPHTWGLVHKPSGREWLNPDGSPARPLAQAQVQMLRAMANASVLPNPATRQASALPAASPRSRTGGLIL